MKSGSNRGRPDPFSSPAEAIQEIALGRMVIVVDDENRENEGDLTIAAEKVTPEAINFMARFGRGLVCMPMSAERLEELRIPLMVERNTSRLGTGFCVSVEARQGVTTGISARDRATTIRALIHPSTRPEDVVRPGHVFPLRARPGGVLERQGQTEAAVDLARLAGLYPAGVICEVMNNDGTMARVPQLARFARRHGLKMVRIADLVRHRLSHETIVERVSQPQLPTRHGRWRLIAYRNALDEKLHVALVLGRPQGDRPCLVRLHSECFTGDVLGSIRCDCGRQLEKAMAVIAREGTGVLLYLRQEGRGIGLLNKLRAYELQDRGKDTVEANHHLGFPADLRDYGVGAQILRDLGVQRVRILSNNPRKFSGLREFGLEIVERLALEVPPERASLSYLRTKKRKLGHILRLV
ncbi:MAG: bifunctional 3,4-dihydroxy-2-butanone-4-phosphate synthase/GTP cyclohydrolase II [Acidobacteria bacterium]|nr:bifunctional 3,4-dihydroxy-2-butanone-4-phosphate synthase/GTP cyclohydrolase II [Acidobacteriota bacterium]